MNVTSVWKHGITGRDVTVCVIDDGTCTSIARTEILNIFEVLILCKFSGIQWKNPDLVTRFEPKGSWDFLRNSPDPTPDAGDPENMHGTRCAGEIAAMANNRFSRQ